MDDTSWIKPPMVVAVLVERFAEDGKLPVLGKGSDAFGLPARYIRPLPTPSPTAQRVVDAAVAWRKKYRAHKQLSDEGDEIAAATDAHIAATTPPDALAVALEALRKIEKRSNRGHTGCNPQLLGDDVTAAAQAAIPIIEAAMKAREERK